VSTTQHVSVLLSFAALLCGVSTSWAQTAPASQPAAQPAATSRFADPADGRFDLSGFLDEAYGFVPLLIPITDPAVGYGALGAAVFIHSKPQAEGSEFVRPSMSTIGVMRTENGTRGWLGGNLGTWRGGRLRTLVALADLDLNLDFFGLGGDRVSGDGLGYSVKGKGGVGGGSFKLGATQLWLGMRYASVDTNVTLQTPLLELPGVSPADYDLDLGALTPSITFDGRDNFFTPTRGWYVDLSVPVFRESLGSDRDFETWNLTAMFYRPLGDSLFLSARASAKDSSDGTPFYLRPYVALRGVQSLEHQGEQAAELEVEVRWQRFSLVGFAGTGEAKVSIAARDRDDSVTAGGAGFRYLIARRHGMHVGVDVAGGDDDTIFYVVFGSAWLRP
jgi:hypothetical protein